MENNDNKSIDEVTIDSIKKDAIRKIDREENVDIEDETREFELSSKNSYERIIPELIITPKDEELESCNIEKGDGIDNDFGQKGEISKCEKEPFSETNEDISIMTAINKDEVEIGESQDFGLEELENCENELVSSDFIESCQPNEGLFDKELVDDLDLNIDEMDSISTTKTTQNNLVGEIASSEEKIVEQITSHDTSVDNLIEIDQTLSMGAESLLPVNEGVNLNISSIENLVLDENIQIDGLNDKEPCGSILGNDTIRNSDEVVSNNVKVDTDQEVIQNAENGANIGKGGMKQSILLSCNEPTSVVDGDTPIATVINLMSENLESDNRSDQQIPYPGSNINDNIIVSGSPEDESIFEIEHIGANESMVIEEDKNKIEAVEVQSIESNTLDIKTNTTREVKIKDNHEQEEEELQKVDRILEEKDVNFEIIDVNDDLIPVENELTSDKTADIIETKEEVKIEANYEQEKDEFKKENSIIEEKGVDLEIIDVNDDSIPVENEPTSDKTAAMIETNEEVKIEANYDQEKDEFKKEDSIIEEKVENELTSDKTADIIKTNEEVKIEGNDEHGEEEFKKEDCIIEEKGVDLEIIDVNNDSIPVENELTSDKTAIIDSSSGVECIRNESPSTFQLSELSLGRQETFLLVSSSNTDTTDESTSKCGVKGLIERFSNNTTTSPSASIKIESIVQQDNVKCDPLSGKLEGREFYEVDDTETGHSNKLSQLIKHFESNTVDKAQRNVLTTDEIVKVVTSDNDVIEVRNEKEVIENKTSKDSEFDPTNIPTIVTDVISDEKDYEDETFSSQHEFDLCSIGSHDDDVVSKSYTDINDGSNDSLTRNGNFGSTEHLLLCVGGMAELEDSEIQPTTTNEEEMNKSELIVDDGKFNEINSQNESAIELVQQDQSLIIVELTETMNHEIDRSDEIGSLETSGEVMKRYGTSNDLLADLMLEENLIENKAEDEEKSLVSFIQIDESMDLKEEEIVKSELEEHPLIVEEAGTEVDNIDLQSQCVKLIDSENSGESFKQDSSSTLNDLLKVVVNSHLSQNEMASQETSMEVPSEIALPPLVETHSAELNETNENPVESSEPRDVCYEILNEISNEKSKTEEDSFLKTSISDKQGTDSTGSELNRSISLIVNSSLESDFCSNLQDEPISECVLETLLSKNENLESVEEPERDSIEDNVLSTEAGEACVEINQKQTTEELEWLDKQTNEIQEPARSLLVNLDDIKDSIEPNMKTSVDNRIENDDSSQIEFDAECEINNSPLKNSDNNGSSMTPMLIDTLINEGSTNHPSESDSNIDNSDLLKETIDENEIAVKIEAHGEDLKEHIDLLPSGDTLLIDQSSTSQNDAEISHTNSLLEPLPVNIDVEESIDHSFEFDENIQATQTPEPVIKYCVPCVDTTSYPPLSNHCSRPSSRMEVIREETEEISDNIQVEETKEEGLSPFLDSDDVSVSDISECLEKFDSLIQETELRDRDLLDIDENKLVEISVTDCDTGEHSDNLLLAESEIPECDRVIDELVDNSNSELGHQDLQGNEDHNSDIDSRDEKIVDVYEIHDIIHDKSPSFNLNADLNRNDSEKSVEKISSGDILVKEGKSTEVAEDDCKKSERKPRKSLVKSKKMFWDEKLKSLQAEQENKSKILIEKRTKTVLKDHSNRNIVQPALEINRTVNQHYDQGEVPDKNMSSTSKMNKSVSQQCNKQKMPDTRNEIRNKDFGKQSHSNTQSKPNLIVEEPVKIVVELSDENNEIVDDRKSVDNWKNYWNNLLVNEKDEETQAMSRQPSIRVKGIVASSRSLFENSNTNLERSVSCEILSNKSVMSDKKRAPARSVGENLNKIGLETPVKSSHIRGENSETLQKSESVSNILERIKFFERSSNETRGGNNIEMTMNFINRKKCSLENTSTPCSPTTIKIDYFDDNQDESLPCQTLKNKKMKSESMDSSDGDLYNPLTMTLSGRVRSFSTGKIDETPDGSLSNIEEDRSAKGSDQCLEKSDEELKNTNTGMLEITTQLSRAKSEGNLSMSEKVTSRARFEQAKSFFKCLEEENLVPKKESRDDCLIPQKPRRLKQISMDSDSCGEGCKPKKKESKYRRRGRRRRKDSSAMKVRSAPTSDSECRMSMYDREFGGSERHKRISERFHVKHLFRDIAGDTDGIFKGIPNRKAVLASLEDLRADSVPDDQQDYEEPSRSHSLSSIPSGYQDEYPYLPTTPPSQYKHRSQLEDRLISRCKLVTYEMEI
ncbi:uncharacterized protein LOC120352856 [Nilaparvata lugens]|uniref:uncharacterized protein LOC120352856 n=1 Tax=Nilaparvata lugens TaxID=108931 RepID=UPI00193D819D|nr:uncharacterized protein LOC120352856 [Nilaparvata lugens]